MHDNEQMHHTFNALTSGLRAALYAASTREGIEAAREAILDADIVKSGVGVDLKVYSSCLDCDGLYEPGFDIELYIDGETYSGVCCKVLSPPVQVKRGEGILELSNFS